MYSAIADNKRKTVLIMALFVVILGALGWVAGSLYGTPSFFYLALIFGSVYALIQYFIASKIAMAVNGAKEVNRREAPRLYKTVENLSIVSGLPMPKVYVIEDPAPNAFATGRDPNHASVAATTGLIDIMSDTELEAVIAHELGHVRNYDIRVMMIVFGLVAAISIVADIMLRAMWFRDDEREVSPIVIVLGIVAAILAPLVATMVQLAVSRRREYLADSSSALLTRYPEGLIGALQKIRDHGSVMQRQNTATAHFFFANPLKANTLTKLFSTHPPIEDRIAKLETMANKL